MKTIKKQFRLKNNHMVLIKIFLINLKIRQFLSVGDWIQPYKYILSNNK